MEFVSAPAWLIIIINGRGLSLNVQMSDPPWLRPISYFVKTAFQGSNVPASVVWLSLFIWPLSGEEEGNIGDIFHAICSRQSSSFLVPCFRGLSK